MPSDKQADVAGHAEPDNAQERAFLIALATEDTIWDWDLKSNKLEFSSKVAKFGYEDWASDPTIEWWESHIHPEDREATLGSVAWAIHSGKKAFPWNTGFVKRMAILHISTTAHTSCMMKAELQSALWVR